MAKTSIEWADRVWNFLAGCSLASPGCTHCYAMGQAARIERMNPGLAHYQGLTQPSKAGPVWTGKIGFAPHKLTEPLRVRKPAKWFVNSMSDLFHEDVPDEIIDQAFAVMALAPHHTFQVLTKRSKRMREYMDKACGRIADAVMALRRETGIGAGSGIAPLPHITPGRAWWPLPNVWLGVSVEDQQRADERIPDLLATPAAVRWISAEPLLGQVSLRKAFIVGPEGGREYSYTPRNMIQWVVVGGESDAKARPMHPDWARSLRDQCAAAGVPFLFKQWGKWHQLYDRDIDDPDWRECGTIARLDRTGQWLNLAGGQGFHGDRVVRVRPVGKARAGRLLDGVEHDAMPRAFQ